MVRAGAGAGVQGACAEHGTDADDDVGESRGRLRVRVVHGLHVYGSPKTDPVHGQHANQTGLLQADEIRMRIGE